MEAGRNDHLRIVRSGNKPIRSNSYSIKGQTQFFDMVQGLCGIRDKIALCHFHPNYIAFYPSSETSSGNAPFLKFDFFKVELIPIVTFLKTYSGVL